MCAFDTPGDHVDEAKELLTRFVSTTKAKLSSGEMEVVFTLSPLGACVGMPATRRGGGAVEVVCIDQEDQSGLGRSGGGVYGANPWVDVFARPVDWETAKLRHCLTIQRLRPASGPTMCRWPAPNRRSVRACRGHGDPQRPGICWAHNMWSGQLYDGVRSRGMHAVVANRCPTFICVFVVVVAIVFAYMVSFPFGIPRVGRG